MRSPVPNNKLVAFTLVGALLTAVVAGALAMPGLWQADEQPSPGTSASDAPKQVAGDTPTPNENFTPAVQTKSGSEHEEHEEYEEDEEDEDYEEEHEEGE